MCPDPGWHGHSNTPKYPLKLQLRSSGLQVSRCLRVPFVATFALAKLTRQVLQSSGGQPSGTTAQCTLNVSQPLKNSTPGWADLRDVPERGSQGGELVFILFTASVCLWMQEIRPDGVVVPESQSSPSDFSCTPSGSRHAGSQAALGWHRSGSVADSPHSTYPHFPGFRDVLEFRLKGFMLRVAQSAPGAT